MPLLMYVWEQESVDLPAVQKLRSEKQKKGKNNDARETQQCIPGPPTLLSTAQQQSTFVMS